MPHGRRWAAVCGFSRNVKMGGKRAGAAGVRPRYGCGRPLCRRLAWRVAHIRPDGSQALYAGSLPGGRPLRPNGIALRRSGAFLLADLGETQGGVFELGRDGSVRPFLEEVDGVELPPSNFVAEDRLGRIWVTVSTRLRPRTRAHRADIADGFIVLKDERGARIVADNLGYTNEAVVSP